MNSYIFYVLDFSEKSSSGSFDTEYTLEMSYCIMNSNVTLILFNIFNDSSY